MKSDKLIAMVEEAKGDDRRGQPLKEPRLITRKMIEENLDISPEGIIANDGMYKDLPFYIPYFHSCIMEGMYDFEEEGSFYFEFDEQDYLEFPELREWKFLVISLSDFSTHEVEIEYELC